MKLSPQQKAENKEASLLRQAAYRARNKELELAEKSISVDSLMITAQNAMDSENSIGETINNAEAHIREQISLLQEQLNQVRPSYAPKIEAAKKNRNAAYQVMRDERERQKKEIESRFPDLTEQTFIGSCAWVPPGGYLEKFVAEHADELAKKKLKRGCKKPM